MKKRNNYKSQKKNLEQGPVRAKKHLGQHFLTDENIAKKIAETLSLNGYKQVLEIGPGTGMLTKYLLQKDIKVVALDLDRESVAYLQESFALEHPQLDIKDNFSIIEADFLKIDLQNIFGQEEFAVTGNFPYNISTQIVFKTLENRTQIPEFTGMFQKEVAKRICEPAGSKAYGILSVLTQTFYTVEYLFTVPPSVFNPPPKVDSGVLRLTRKEDFSLPVEEKLFFKVVKTAFQQRRKTLRNSLKSFGLSQELREEIIFGQRPEQLSVEEFINLTQKIEADAVSNQ
ncbi:16S rRNA (adenine(1518)-N(6)/adenine(1519)-N(6))-dimethyltransferase RsmA [Haloflavibacter putidus]|uniref:Ribosomal RNA small subunit methyltransferase A n=1 Tax=Haloflavibacter putidus TaxID=2576776 RepID=A0A507ZIY0_9FLAO|nr:16S rRNA (adenine(1518)-N(6)/adenine(1519)-N(6))-dimethyltransferase RsmA [Haloflavibacter putidus]TQD36937.1 16S rRNA (adenine(1518)-N(6)/adenine(1519)-N(6))-dimethyltransferase RsmA [Haloflavibacter putidus]